MTKKPWRQKGISEKGPLFPEKEYLLFFYIFYKVCNNIYTPKYLM